MGTVTVTGAMIIITAWMTLVEFDSYSESERKKVINNIKSSFFYMMVISLMPLGILINMLGSFFALAWLVSLGTLLIFLQGFIIALLFWNRTRWKSVLLLVVIIILIIFIYLPLLF